MTDKERWLENTGMQVNDTVLLIDDPQPWRKSGGVTNPVVVDWKIGQTYRIQRLWPLITGRMPNTALEGIAVYTSMGHVRWVPFWCLIRA